MISQTENSSEKKDLKTIKICSETTSTPNSNSRCQMNMVLTPELRQRLSDKSKAMGMQSSAYVRFLIIKDLQGEHCD